MLSAKLRLTTPVAARGFKTFAPALFKAGDSIPTGLKGLHESSPGNTVDLGKEVQHGKYVIVGLPAAFSPACSASHVPGYIKHLDQLKEKGVKQVFVTAVNDSFVTQAWAESLGVPSDIRIIADTLGEFAKAGDHLFDSKQIFGNERSIRYAVIVQDGKVVQEFAEPDKIGVDVSSAENVLKHL
ncbi:Redoxin domain-containing protein [Kluyveromyces marxianus]